MTLQNVQNAIQRLEAIDPVDEFAYEKAFLAFLTIKQLPVCLVTLDEGISLFRTRTHETDNFFTSISDISIAPNFVTKSFARCNRPFQSRFYGSFDRATSYMELVGYWTESRNAGDKIYVTIGAWETRKSLVSIVVSTPDAAKRLSDYDKKYGAILDGYLKQIDSALVDGTKLFYEYMFEVFRRPANRDPKTYFLTTAYCNMALTQCSLENQKVDAVFYPSVPFGGQGVNLCINSAFIQAGGVELVHAMRNEMTVGVNTSSKHTFTETGVNQCTSVDSTGGVINW